MKERILLIGGNGSGKTKAALKMGSHLHPRLYVATGTALDAEMRRKIDVHKRERRGWDTLQSPTLDPKQIEFALASRSYRCAVVDCVSFLIHNCMAKGMDPQLRLREALEAMEQVERLIIVSNEVGLSLVPTNSLARRFTKTLSEINRYLTETCNRSYLVVAGKLISLSQDLE